MAAKFIKLIFLGVNQREGTLVDVLLFSLERIIILFLHTSSLSGNLGWLGWWKNIYKCLPFAPAEIVWATSIFLQVSLAGGGEKRVFRHRIGVVCQTACSKLERGYPVSFKAILKSSKASAISFDVPEYLLSKNLVLNLPMHRTSWSSLKV